MLLCSGKVYYDLDATRATSSRRDDVAIVRLEQLYPLDDELDRERSPAYKDGTPLVWVQEEPWNMGAWYFMNARLADAPAKPLSAHVRLARREREPGDRLAREPRSRAEDAARRSVQTGVAKPRPTSSRNRTPRKNRRSRAPHTDRARRGSKSNVCAKGDRSVRA